MSAVDKGPDLVGATLGQYQIEALIGQGGMGYVYRARDTALARAVALKILPPEMVSDAGRLARFIQEARSASALNHPHVIAIHEIRAATAMRDGAAIPGLPLLHYLAMELVTGDTLRTLIGTRRLDMKRAIELLIQVAEALSAAHAAGVVHRDLKPENIMVAASGYAKVLDFGLAKLRPDLAASDAATLTGGQRTGNPAGNGRLHVAGAGRGAAHRSSLRCLFVRLRALRSGGRHARLCRTLDHRDAAPYCDRRSRIRCQHDRLRTARAPAHRWQVPRQGS